MLKAILFDFDGTIVDSLKHHLSAYQRTFKYFKASISDEEIISKIFYPSVLQKETIIGLGIDYDHFWEIQRGYIAEALTTMETHEHFDQTLKDLHTQGLRFAVVSFAPSNQLKKELDRLNLERYFPVVLGGNDVKKPKPDPEIALKAMDELGVKKDETVLIGDTNYDIETGKNAGILTGLFIPITNRLYSDIDLFRQSKPDFEFNSYQELPDRLEQIKNTYDTKN